MKKQIIKLFSLLTVLALAITIFSPLGLNDIKAGKKVKINKKTLTIETGEKAKLKLKNKAFEPEEITWTSSDKAVAKVSKKGWVTGYVRGNCTITATINASGKTYTCEVTVNAPDVTKRVIDPEKPIIALTFDDGPCAGTPDVLETLADYGVTATFFMNYKNAPGFATYPDIVRQVYNSGNEVANHTKTHPQLNKISKEKIDDEVNGNADLLRDLLGQDNKFICRPPYGAYNDTVKETVDCPLITWSVDTLDWKYKGQSNCTEMILQNLKNEAYDGGIILMHDIHKTSRESADEVIEWCIKQGYQVCSVSEMFEARGVELENGKVYSRCISAEKYKELNNK